MLAMQPLVIVEVAADDPQSVILRPRYQPAIDHAVYRPHRRLEPPDILLDLRPQRANDQHPHREAPPPRAEPGVLAHAHCRSLQRMDAPHLHPFHPPHRAPTTTHTTPTPV